MHLPFHQLEILSICSNVNLTLDQLTVSPTNCLPAYHFTISEACPFDNLQFYQLAVLSAWRLVILQFYQLAVFSTCSFINLQSGQFAILLTSHFINLLLIQITVTTGCNFSLYTYINYCLIKFLYFQLAVSSHHFINMPFHQPVVLPTYCYYCYYYYCYYIAISSTTHNCLLCMEGAMLMREWELT